MNTIAAKHCSNVFRFFMLLGDPVGKSLDEIRSVIGESDETRLGDPLLFLPDSLSRVWKFKSRTVTLYFDINDVCFGADCDHVILPFGENPLSKREILKLLGNFI